MVTVDSFRRPILPGFFWIGVNSRRHFGRGFVITLKVRFQFMSQTAREYHLILAGDDFLDQLMSNRGSLCAHGGLSLRFFLDSFLPRWGRRRHFILFALDLLYGVQNG